MPSFFFRQTTFLTDLTPAAIAEKCKHWLTAVRSTMAEPVRKRLRQIVSISELAVLRDECHTMLLVGSYAFS